MSLVDFLDEQRVSYRSLLHPPAYTALRRAKYLGISGGRVARAVLLLGPDGFFLAVLPATHQIDLAGLSRLWGGPIRLAHKDEASRVFRDCEWGVVSPFGSRYGLPTLIDAGLPADSWIVLEGGLRHEAFLMRCADFERLSGSFRARFARRGAA